MLKANFFTQFTIFSMILSISSTPVFAQTAEDEPIFTPEKVEELAEEYGVSEGYIESLNSSILLEEKNKELENAEEQYKTYLANGESITTVTKTVYLDSNRLFPITVKDTSMNVHESSNQSDSEISPLQMMSYSSSYNLPGLANFTQHVSYDAIAFNINTWQTSVVYTYGTFNGIGSSSNSSNHSTGYQYRSRARTTFSYSESGIQASVTANSNCNSYGTWSTSWS